MKKGKLFHLIMTEVYVGRNSQGCPITKVVENVVAERLSAELKPEIVRGMKVGESRYLEDDTRITRVR
jgi:hypothetical protein